MSITETLQLSFDYAALDPTVKDAVILHRDAIKNLLRRTAQDIWNIGQHLVQVKDWLGHGLFADWLEKEFCMKERTAQNFMAVYKSFRYANFADLNIATSALYLMASASEPVREELVDRAIAGETITHAMAKQVIAAAKPNITVGTATVLEPSPQTEDSDRPDLALTPSIDEQAETQYAYITERGSSSSIGLQEEDPEETHGFKRGDIVAGFYNPTGQYEVGALEHYSPSAYSLLVKADGARCGVVTNTLRHPTEAEEDEYFAPAPVPATEPAAFIASRSGTDEHYTPDWVWKPALEVIEGQKFALDPASNSHHSPNVPAETVYTIDDDGLTHDWTEADSIWINPPFSQMDEFVVKADLEAQGHLFFLAKCDCRPAWFSRLCDLCCSFVLIHKSVKFLGNENSSFFGVAIFYRGPDPDKFYRAYQHLGTVCMPVVPGLLGE